MSESADTKIYLDGNDKIERFPITTPAADTGDDEAATGLTGLTVHYSLTRGGAAIHADVTKNLTEYSGTPGTYHATEEGDAITARLTAYAGQRIFAVVKDSGGNVKANVERVVVANRTI